MVGSRALVRAPWLGKHPENGGNGEGGVNRTSRWSVGVNNCVEDRLCRGALRRKENSAEACELLEQLEAAVQWPWRNGARRETSGLIMLP